jgi:predicted O-methyltransferase YrrM
VLETEPVISVEIGVFAGKSLFAIGGALQALGDDRKVYGIEPWNNAACEQGYEEGDENREWWGAVNMNLIERGFYDVRKYLNLEEKTVAIKAKSEDAVTKFEEWNQKGHPIDFLHIDGNHTEEVSARDVELFVPLVRKGGLIFFDDINWEPTKKAQDQLERLADLQRLEEGEGYFYGVFEKR